AATPDGRGYWLVGSDGGVFAFGDARFFGSGTRGAQIHAAVGIEPSPDGRGYWLLESAGIVERFVDAAPIGGPAHSSSAFSGLSVVPHPAIVNFTAGPASVS